LRFPKQLRKISKPGVNRRYLRRKEELEEL